MTMTEIYKLTRRDHTTRGGVQWGSSVRQVIPNERRRPLLCSDGVFHGYRTPLLAAFMRPAHCPDYLVPWRCETPEIVVDDNAQIGVYELTTLEVIELPRPTAGQCVRFGILSALKVCDDPKFAEWAESWLSGKNRSRAVSRATARAAAEAWDAPAELAAAAAAAWAERDAEEAMMVAAWAAEAAAVRLRRRQRGVDRSRRKSKTCMLAP